MKIIISTLLILFITVTVSTAQWSNKTVTDKITGEKRSYAMSAYTPTDTPMGFPYSDIKAKLAVGCDNESEWVYISFNDKPNVTASTTRYGHNTIYIRTRFDDEVIDATLIQDFDSPFIHFYDTNGITQKIEVSNTLLIELEWYGEGKVYFEFSLSGSTDAIGRMRNQCSE